MVFGGGTGSAPADAFVARLNPQGTHFDYVTYLGGSGNDEAFGIAVDAGGNAYVTGYTESADFPTTSGAFQTCLTQKLRYGHAQFFRKNPAQVKRTASGFASDFL